MKLGVTSILFLLLTAVSNFSFGQYEKVYFKDTVIETAQVRIMLDNIVAVPKELKFRMTITNKTDDWILYDSEASKFEVNGTTQASNDKYVLIPPRESKNRVMRTLGVNMNTTREFKFLCDGLKLVKLQKALVVEPFRLPAAKNQFEFGNFKVTMINLEKTTSKTDVKFQVEYNGDGLGFVSPAKVSVKMPDGNSYATIHAKKETFVVKHNEPKNFNATWERMTGGAANDMQLVEMFIQFEGVFQESTQTDLKALPFSIRWDDALTIGKKK
jgi:hypothetical protein